LSYAPDFSAKNALIDPVTLTFKPQNSTTSRVSQIIPYTKFKHFGIIRFWVTLRTNKQTNRQTDRL